MDILNIDKEEIIKLLSLLNFGCFKAKYNFVLDIKIETMSIPRHFDTFHTLKDKFCSDPLFYLRSFGTKKELYMVANLPALTIGNI